MADRDSERDRRVRELLSGKKKDQMAVLGQSRAEVQDIQSELQNHIALQQAQDQSRLQQAQTISQAAEGMLAMEQSNQLQGQVAAMNPQTQATMGKFGVKPQRTQNTTRNQSGGRTISKSGDITNIKNETITNNRTEIKVTQPTIPMSQPNIAVQASSGRKEDNTAKFKAWLSGMFAKQQNEAEIQKKEYRRKEWNLGRTTSRLMKRIEESTSALGQKLDPKNMTSTLGGQLKWLLMIFGATMIAKVWKPAMEFLANLEGGFRAVFGLPMNTDLRNASQNTLSVIDQIKGFIGIKKGEDTSLIKGIGRVFMEGIDKLIDKLKFWFEDRATALRGVEFPSFDTPDFGPLGKVMAPIMNGLTDTFKSMTQYLGDLITVAMGGSKGRAKAAARKVTKQVQDVFTDTTGKQTSAGDSALMTGRGRNYMRKSDYDNFGNLKSDASSTQAMSQSLISMLNDKSGKTHTTEISTGISQLFDVADRSGKVVIDPELLGYLGLTPADIQNLKRNKYLHQEKYRIIGVKPTTDEQRKELGAYTGHAGYWAEGIVGTTSGAILGIPGMIAGGFLGSVFGANDDEYLKRKTTKGLYPKLVPADSREVGDDGSPGFPKMMWVLTKQGADYVTKQFTHEMNNKEMDIINQEFYEKIRKIEENRKRTNGVRGPLTQNLQTKEVNDFKVKQAQLTAYNREYYDRYESRDPNSYNMIHFGHLNTAMDNTTAAIDRGRTYLSNGIRSFGNYVSTSRITGKQKNQRAAYLINRLIQEGLSPEAAAGVAGNIKRESEFNSEAINPNDPGGSGGICQWNRNAGRLGKIEGYFGKDITQIPFTDQVEYLIKEMKSSRPLQFAYNSGLAEAGDTMWDVVARASSIDDAAVRFERAFEGSQDWKLNGNKIRISNALAAYDSWKEHGKDGVSLEELNKFSKDTTLGKVTGAVGGAINWVADKVGVEKDNFSALGNTRLTDKQRQALERHIKYKNTSARVNINSYLALGAKVDNTGMFFEDHGGNRAYVNANRTSGILGLTESAIEYTAKRGADGKFTGDISKEDQDMIKRSVILKTESLFSSYSEKGTTSDFMSVDGKPMEFDLGSFNDLNFSKDAIYDFNNIHRGYIHYYITPTKDRTGDSLVRINPIPNPMLKAFEGEKDFLGDKEIGPYIYKKGWKRKNVGSVDRNSTTDWQPLALFYGVGFTPKALERKALLYKLLSYGKLYKDGSGFKTSEGKYLSDSEVKLAAEFGILSASKSSTLYSGAGSGEVNNHKTTYYAQNDSYNKAQEIASSLFRDKQFNYDEYIKRLGISSEKDVNKFYEENKDLFYNKNGILIGPAGIEWGTVDKNGKVTLYNKKEFSDRAMKTGTSGFASNMDWIQKETARQSAINLGMIDRNSIVDLFGSVDTKSPITKEEQKKLDKLYGTTTNYIDKWGMLAGTKYQYRVFFNESGDPINYQITREVQRKVIENITGLQVGDKRVRSDINTRNPKNMLKILSDTVKDYINKYITDNREKSNKLGEIDPNSTFNVSSVSTEGLTESNNPFSPYVQPNEIYKRGVNESDKLFSFLVKKQRLVSDIDISEDGCTVIYESGIKEKTSYKISKKLMNDEEKKTFISKVNAAISEGKEKIFKLRFSEKYEGSDLQKNTNAVLEGIKSGELEGIEDENGNVYSATTGDLVGTVKMGKDGTKEYQYLTSDAQLNFQRENFFSNQDNKIDAYKRLFGAVQEGTDLYVYNKTRTARVKLDLSKPFSTDLHSLMIGSSVQGKEGDSDKWINVNEAGDQEYDPKTGKYENRVFKALINTDDKYKQENVLASIMNDIKGSLDDSIDIQEKAREMLIEKLEDQLNQDLIAAKKQTEQIINEKRIALATRKQADLFEAWANSGFKTDVDMGAIIDEINNRESSEMANTIYNRALAEQKTGGNEYKGKRVVKEGNIVYLEKREEDGSITRQILTVGSDNQIDIGKAEKVYEPAPLKQTNKKSNIPTWYKTGVQMDNPKSEGQNNSENNNKTGGYYSFNNGNTTYYDLKIGSNSGSGGSSDASLSGVKHPATTKSK